MIADKEVPTNTEQVIDPDAITGKTDEEKKEIKEMLKKFWTHVRKAHEEAACVAGELSMVIEPEDYFKIVEAGT